MRDFQMEWHDNPCTYPEWGSNPRGPLIRCDMAHQGELMDSTVGPDVLTGKPMVYHIVRCELCIFSHIWPLPREVALAEYYRTHFYQIDKHDMVKRYEEDRQWWEYCIHGPILHTVHGFLSQESDITPLRMLDVGAGVGIALDVAQHQYGWETWGLEPNEEQCEALALRQHKMVCGTLVDACENIQLPKFHCVYMYETLEHLLSPDDTLLQIYDILEPDGIVVVVVPQEYNKLQLAACAQLGLPHYWLAPPIHVNYFSPKTLQLLLRRTGFRILDCRATYPMEQFLLKGRNYVGNDALGRLCHKERMAEELASVQNGTWRDREQEYRDNLTERIGREMIFIGRRLG